MVQVSFDLYVIGSWDGSSAESKGPDVWKLNVLGGPTLVNTTFSNCEPLPQAFPDTYPRGTNEPTAGAVATNALGYTEVCVPSAAKDAVYHISTAFPWTAQTLSLVFSGYGLQSIADESWGLDNVAVSVR